MKTSPVCVVIPASTGLVYEVDPAGGAFRSLRAAIEWLPLCDGFTGALSHKVNTLRSVSTVCIVHAVSSVNSQPPPCGARCMLAC